MMAATANAQQGGVVDTKAEVRKAAEEYVKQCSDNVKKSRSVLKQHHRAEREALGKSVNTPEYRALQQRQQKQREFANGIHKGDKTRVRKDAREAIQKGEVINTRLTSNICYYVPTQ